MQVIKRKLKCIGINSRQMANNEDYKKYKNKIYSIYDVNKEFRKKLKYERNKKNKKNILIYPKFYRYSHADTYQNRPIYYYMIEDIKRFSEYINVDYKIIESENV